MVSKKNWIVATGRHDGKEIKLAITNGIAGQLYDAWNALVAVGAVPVGPPPAHPNPGLSRTRLRDGPAATPPNG